MRRERVPIDKDAIRSNALEGSLHSNFGTTIWMFPKIEVSPNHPILIGFYLILTIHLGVPLFLETPICMHNSWPLLHSAAWNIRSPGTMLAWFYFHDGNGWNNLASWERKHIRWFKVTFSFPSWRSLSLSKRSFNPSQKGHQQNWQVPCSAKTFSS